MVQVQLTYRQVLLYIIYDIQNGRHEVAAELLQQCEDELNSQSKTNQALDPDGKKPPQVS